MSPRSVDPERVAERRAAILGAAAVEFADRGYDGARATDIARRAGVSSGTVFYYFGDKAGLFRAMFAADGPRITQLTQAAARLTDPLAAMLLLVDGLAADSVAPEAATFVVELVRRVTLDPELAQVVAANDRTVREAMTAQIARGRTDGRFDPSHEPAVAATTVSAMIDGLYLAAEPGRDLRPALRRAVAAYLCSPDLTGSVA